MTERAIADEPGITARLAQFAAATRPGDLPRAVVHASERIILDTIACALGAVGTEHARIVTELKLAQGGRPEASVVASGARLPAESAAFINAHLANILDADETLLNRSHTAAGIVLPALAMAEAVGASGRDLVAAVALGFEVSSRIGFALSQWDTGPDGTLRFSPVAGFSWASIGAAVATGRLIGLDAARMAQAFGTVCALTPVQWNLQTIAVASSTDGADPLWHKYGMYGAIAEAGINAAKLAAKGFRSNARVFDHGSDFWRSFGGLTIDWDFPLADLGARWFIAETAIKPYPFCRFGHAGIDLFTRIVRENGLSAGDIDEITVTIPPFDMLKRIVGNRDPDDPHKILLSIPYAYAMVVAGIPPGPRWWAAEQFGEPRHRAFARKVKPEINQDWNALLVEQLAGGRVFKRLPTAVEVRGRRGRWSAMAEYAWGDTWEKSTEFTDADLTRKVVDFSEDAIGREAAMRLAEAGLGLDAEPDTGRLVRAMTGAPELRAVARAGD